MKILLIAVVLMALCVPVMAPDMEVNTEHKESVYYEFAKPEIVGGTRVQIIVGSNTIFDKTVPQGKKLINASLIISADVADE